MVFRPLESSLGTHVYLDPLALGGRRAICLRPIRPLAALSNFVGYAPPFIFWASVLPLFYFTEPSPADTHGLALWHFCFISSNHVLPTLMVWLRWHFCFISSNHVLPTLMVWLCGTSVLFHPITFCRHSWFGFGGTSVLFHPITFCQHSCFGFGGTSLPFRLQKSYRYLCFWAPPPPPPDHLRHSQDTPWRRGPDHECLFPVRPKMKLVWCPPMFRFSHSSMNMTRSASANAHRWLWSHVWIKRF